MSLSTLPFAGNLAHDYIFIRSQDRVSGTSVNFRVQLPEQYEGVTGVELIEANIPNSLFNITAQNNQVGYNVGDPRLAALLPVRTTRRRWDLPLTAAERLVRQLPQSCSKSSCTWRPSKAPLELWAKVFGYLPWGIYQLEAEQILGSYRRMLTRLR